MSTHYVRAPGQDFVVVIPRTTARDSKLSYRARGVLQRLLSNAEGYSQTAEDLASEGKEGRDAIRAALRELQAAGYITRHSLTNAAGQFTGSTAYVYASPQPPAGRPAGKPAAGNPLAGLPSLKSSKSRTEQESSSTRSAAAAPDASSGASTERKRRRVHAETGVSYWYDDELQVIKIMVEEFSLPAVRAVVDAFVRRGSEPLPTLVSAVLMSQRLQHTQADAAAQRRETTAEDRAAYTAAAEQWIADMEGGGNRGRT